MTFPSRIIQFDAGQARGRQPNASTHLFGRSPIAAEPPDFESLFVHNYAGLRAACLRRERGVVLCAMNVVTGRLAGSVWVAARADRINTAIVGRHDRADLFLEGDPALSLRHLALVVFPSPNDDVRFRLADLRTQCPFLDERGRRLDALEATGPVFVRSGSHALACFVTGGTCSRSPSAGRSEGTGSDDAWPADPRAAWGLVPERVYPAEVAAADARDAWRQRAVPSRPITFITLVDAPAAPGERRLCADDEVPLGKLTVSSGERTRSFDLGPRAAQAGVLLGAYDRCDDRVLEGGGSVSRVHAWVVRVGDRLWAVDTASTNGTFDLADPASPRRVRSMPLDGRTSLGLGNSGRAEWAPIDSA